MAEGRSFQVKGHNGIVRLDHLKVATDDIHKAVQRIGWLSILSGQRANAIKGAIENAVTVNDKYFLFAHGSLTCFSECLASPILIIVSIPHNGQFCQGGCISLRQFY